MRINTNKSFRGVEGVHLRKTEGERGRTINEGAQSAQSTNESVLSLVDSLMKEVSKRVPKTEYEELSGKLKEFIEARKKGIETSWDNLVGLAKAHPKLSMAVSGILGYLASSTLIKAYETRKLKKDIEELRRIQRELEQQKKELESSAKQRSLRGVIADKLKTSKGELLKDMLMGSVLGIAIALGVVNGMPGLASTSTAITLGIGAGTGALFGLTFNVLN